MKLIYGVGINDLTEPTRYSKGVNTKEYNLWLQMLRRCYSEKALKRNPTYSDCYVTDDWIHFSIFAKQIRQMKGFNEVSFELDKDLLFKGNKLYSLETTCFLPKSVNSALTIPKLKNKDLPCGVTYYEGRYWSRLPVINHRKSHKTSESAFEEYKVVKENYIRSLADVWKGKIDERAYTALSNYIFPLDVTLK